MNALAAKKETGLTPELREALQSVTPKLLIDGAFVDAKSGKLFYTEVCMAHTCLLSLQSMGVGTESKGIHCSDIARILGLGRKSLMWRKLKRRMSSWLSRRRAG